MIPRTVVIGLGNVILTDDGVGIHAARLIRERAPEGVDVTEVHAGGLRLMDAMVGYDRAFIIDAMQCGTAPGTVRRFSVTELHATRNMTSTHDTSLGTALQMAAMLGLQVPTEVTVWGIEALDAATFGEELSQEVSAAMDVVVSELLTAICAEAVI